MKCCYHRHGGRETAGVSSPGLEVTEHPSLPDEVWVQTELPGSQQPPGTQLPREPLESHLKGAHLLRLAQHMEAAGLLESPRGQPMFEKPPVLGQTLPCQRSRSSPHAASAPCPGWIRQQVRGLSTESDKQDLGGVWVQIGDHCLSHSHDHVDSSPAHLHRPKNAA